MAVIEQSIKENYAVYNADCMEVLPTLKADSIDFSVYSPAFPELYQYSNDPRDMSNCVNYEEGMKQYQFIVDQIGRLTKPGRLTAVHCMDLKKGTQFQRDFPGDIVRAHEAAGFNFFCRITIWKDPWLIARRTRMRSLMHKMIVQDSSMCRVAGPDYLLVFKKQGTNEVPIQHPHGLKTYAGETQVPEELVANYSKFTGDNRKNLLSHWIWRRYASPVWMDIRGGRLMPYREARENREEKHVCPLQLDVIERALTLWSNPGDVVLTPFMGVGSEVFGALQNGRRAIGIELKPTYYRQACENIQNAHIISDDRQISLFDDEWNEDDTDDSEEIEEETP
jgi:DNA modification methylase